MVASSSEPALARQTIASSADPLESSEQLKAEAEAVYCVTEEQDVNLPNPNYLSLKVPYTSYCKAELPAWVSLAVGLHIDIIP